MNIEFQNSFKIDIDCLEIEFIIIQFESWNANFNFERYAVIDPSTSGDPLPTNMNICRKSDPTRQSQIMLQIKESPGVMTLSDSKGSPSAKRKSEENDRN